MIQKHHVQVTPMANYGIDAHFLHIVLGLVVVSEEIAFEVTQMGHTRGSANPQKVLAHPQVAKKKHDVGTEADGVA